MGGMEIFYGNRRCGRVRRQWACLVLSFLSTKTSIQALSVFSLSLGGLITSPWEIAFRATKGWRERFAGAPLCLTQSFACKEIGVDDSQRRATVSTVR